MNGGRSQKVQSDNILSLAVNMAGSSVSVKLFRFIQKFRQACGIFPHQSSQKQLLINSIRIILLISLAETILTLFEYFLFEAKSMFEYGLVFCILDCFMNFFIIYLTLIWQSENTSKFIKKCEEFIEKSKYRSIV